jgi:hypothetical protein
MAEIQGLELVEAASRHLGVRVMKPCVAVYLVGQAAPSVGNRNLVFYALASDLRRSGATEGQALQALQSFFLHNQAVCDEPGPDGRCFTWGEAQRRVTSAYRSLAVKSYGCNAPVWALTCVRPENCLFHRMLAGGRLQSPAAARATLMAWVARPDLLTGPMLRVYLALEAVERKHRFPAGRMLYTSWSEIGGMAGILRQNVGRVLQALHWCGRTERQDGLITYVKGKARERDRANIGSEVRRTLPMPSPPPREEKPE